MSQAQRALGLVAMSCRWLRLLMGPYPYQSSLTERGASSPPELCDAINPNIRNDRGRKRTSGKKVHHALTNWQGFKTITALLKF
jgi:hypothetical protein